MVCYTTFMTIRPATKEDKKQILKLIHEFDEYFAHEHLFLGEILPFTEYKNKNELLESVVDNWLQNEENFIFVADENASLVGYIIGSIQAKKERILDKEGSIDEWFVTESERSTGIGRLLYNALLRVFKENNCNHIGLKVYSTNKNTIDMYHKMGFMDLELTMVKKID